jgi:hypothetical protein
VAIVEQGDAEGYFTALIEAIPSSQIWASCHNITLVLLIRDQVHTCRDDLRMVNALVIRRELDLSILRCGGAG